MTSLGTTFRAVVVEVFGVQSTWRLVKYRPDATYVGDGAAIVKRKDFAEGEWPPRVGDVVEVKIEPRVRLLQRGP